MNGADAVWVSILSPWYNMYRASTKTLEMKQIIGDRKKSSSDMQPVYKYRSLGLFREQKKLLIEESYCLQSEAPLFL